MLDLAELVGHDVAHFRTQDELREPIRRVCERHADLASYYDLGESEEGRPLYSVVLGDGPQTVSLIAGAHADEPVGPETLRTFVLEGLRRRDELEPLWKTCRFVVIPHVNPDGEARNRAWIEAWPSLEAFLKHAVRELPGRDVEFGFPDMRRENRLVSEFLRRFSPFCLHASLHGMAFGEGAMLLIERHWAFRTQALRDRFAAATHEAGLPLHDHNRKGEKGFFYIEPGFMTTPEGEAMRTYFRAEGDDATARQFHDSSMEFVRSLGGDPLCVVTELPLFLLSRTEPESSQPGYPATYHAFRMHLPEIRRRILRGEPVEAVIAPFEMTPVDLNTAMGLQLRAIQFALEALPVALPGLRTPSSICNND